jgi:hypothetical protein
MGTLVNYSLDKDEVNWLCAGMKTFSPQARLVDLCTRFVSESVDRDWAIRGLASERRMRDLAFKGTALFPDPFRQAVADLESISGHQVGPSSVIRLALKWGMAIWPTEGSPDAALVAHRDHLRDVARAAGPSVIVWVSIDERPTLSIATIASEVRYAPASLVRKRFRRALTRSGNPLFDEVLAPQLAQESVPAMLALLSDRIEMRWDHLRDQQVYPRLGANQDEA